MQYKYSLMSQCMHNLYGKDDSITVYLKKSTPLVDTCRLKLSYISRVDNTSKMTLGCVSLVHFFELENSC